MRQSPAKSPIKMKMKARNERSKESHRGLRGIKCIRRQKSWPLLQGLYATRMCRGEPTAQLINLLSRRLLANIFVTFSPISRSPVPSRFLQAKTRSRCSGKPCKGSADGNRRKLHFCRRLTVSRSVSTIQPSLSRVPCLSRERRQRAQPCR